MLDKLALGTAQLGSNYGVANKTGQPSQNEAGQIILYAISAGVKHIDTALAYGDSEKVIGAALSGIDRNTVIIATKLSPFILENATSQQQISDKVDESINQSLQSLRTKTLDILMLHRWAHFNHETVRKRLLYWKNEGVIKKLGASLSSPAEAIEALGCTEIEFIQIPFNILDWRFRDKELQKIIAQRDDVTIQARSAFLQGILVSGADIWPKNACVDASGIINQLDKFVTDFNRQNRADLCIAYLRSLDWIDNIVVGMETLAQLNSNIELFKQPSLSQSQIEIIEKTFVNCPETLLNPALWNK
jgi:aryl-alcohol dehydrogenase-like predicted oxidoreductase